MSIYGDRAEQAFYSGCNCSQSAVLPFAEEIGMTREQVLKLVGGLGLRDLFQMTPYYWKTPKAGAERLAALDGLRVRAQFRIHVFQKI